MADPSPQNHERSAHDGRGRCATAWLAGLCAWILTGGCAWRLPSEAPADLQRTLDQAARMEDSHAKNALLTAALHARVEEFQSLIECNMLLREKILREANRLEESFRQKRDLTPGDLKLVSEGAAKYLQLRDELLALVDRYQCLLDYSEEELLRRGVDPRLRLVAIMVSVGTTQIAPVALVALVATAPSQPDNVTLISNTPPASGGPS